jgi:fructose-1,6-bisphosphatase/inositol monophosphatase family enzyme
VVEEAGGRISLCDGTPFVSRVGDIVASNGPIHPAMLAVIQTWRADRAAKRTP